MCDYCGCRRQAPIDELSDEHERVLDLGYRLRHLARRSDHAAVVRVLEDEFVPLLEVHTAKEERGLFTELRGSWDADDRLDSLVDEHRDLAVRLETVVAGGPGWEASLVALLADLSDHVLAEETDLFPYALYELGAAQWRAVEEAHAAVHGHQPVG